LLLIVPEILLGRELEVVLPALSPLEGTLEGLFLVRVVSLHTVGAIFTLLALALFGDGVDLMRLMLSVLPRELVCLLLDLKKRFVCVALVQGAFPLLGALRGCRGDQASRLVRLEKGVFPLQVFSLADESGLLDFEEGVPRDLLLNLNEKIVTPFLALSELNRIHTNQLSQHFLIFTSHIIHSRSRHLSLEYPINQQSWFLIL
jgi:hypothetical protein